MTEQRQLDGGARTARGYPRFKGILSVQLDGAIGSPGQFGALVKSGTERYTMIVRALSMRPE